MPTRFELRVLQLSFRVLQLSSFPSRSFAALGKPHFSLFVRCWGSFPTGILRLCIPTKHFLECSIHAYRGPGKYCRPHNKRKKLCRYSTNYAVSLVSQNTAFELLWSRVTLVADLTNSQHLSYALKCLKHFSTLLCELRRFMRSAGMILF